MVVYVLKLLFLTLPKYIMGENMNERKVFNKHRSILNITITAVFSALCFASLFLRIYIPSVVGRPYIHFGNLIIILAALLFTGPVGAISGAIGMGVFDLIDGYGIWTIKTIILKLLIGLITGIVYNLMKKKNRNVGLRIFVISILFLIFGIIMLIIAISKNGILTIGSKEFDLWPMYVFSLILGIFLLVVGVVSKNKNKENKIAIYASSIALMANIIGEFIGKLIKCLLEGQGMDVSVISSLASLPATVINSLVTIIAIILIYPVLKRALSNTSLIISDEESENKNDNE